MYKYIKLILCSMIVIVISIALYFFYINNYSTKEEPKRAKFVNAGNNQNIEVIYYREN